MQSDRIAQDAGGAIDIWSWSLKGSPSEVSEYEALLSDDEHARAERFIHARHRTDFVVARGKLRQILAAYGDLDPRDLTFDYNRYGKPRIGAGQELNLHFNLSHSADLAVLAVSPTYEIGVDIEEKKALQEDVASHFFSPKEQATLSVVSPETYLDHFYRCWTRKEAFVKAHGAGLSLALDSFDITFDEDTPPRLERLDREPDASSIWSLLNVRTPPNFAGAVAAQTFGDPVYLRYHTAD
jgi:4'-phosphopantetheinyl transferase